MREKYQITNLHMLKLVVIPQLRKQHFKMAPNIDKPSFRSRIANCLEELEEEEGRPIFLLPDHLIFRDTDSDGDSDNEGLVQVAPPPTPTNPFNGWVELGRGMEMLTGMMPLDYEMYIFQQFRAFNDVEQYAELPVPTSLSYEEEYQVLRNFLLEGFLWNQQLLAPDQVERAVEDLFEFFRQEVDNRETPQPTQPPQPGQREPAVRWSRANDEEVDLGLVVPEQPQQTNQHG